jgi:hypothetical protein
MRETWIASGGQRPSNPEAVFKAAQQGMHICAAMSPEEETEK